MKIKDVKAYELVEERTLEDLNSIGYILRHKKSGARISVISNDDENKVFYVGFRTPPEDSTGVAHIIEHTVLCGSEKFPLKDPFVELVKGSLNTFLNAMTYPDKTVYPVASCNEKDFQNLMDVYFDAVLHPNIYKYQEIFRQEGWHYELEDKNAPITLNGVVYNEMKGAFSSPEGVLDREILNSLFPDTSYGNESGGDPQFIPDLTYEDYIRFHQRYYHPSNSYIYLYGDMDIAEKLDWMDREYLSHYDVIKLDSEIKFQKPFEKEREIYKKYPVSSTEALEDNSYLSYNMVIGTSLDKKLYQAFEILDYALLNAPGAPLKQTLIDAGIGKDIMGSYDNGSYQPVFSVIAKNANRSDLGRFKDTILQVLKEQADGGLNRKAVLAAINSSEFKFREADFGSFPKGLLYGLQSFDSWLYEENTPFMHLEATETFRFLREQVETGYFEELIKKYMLGNTHASMVVIEPEHGLNAKIEKELEDKLEAYKKSLSEAEILKLIEDTAHLREYQEEASPKEDIEKIPMLKRSDMKKEAAKLQNQEIDCDGTKVIFHEMFSAGIDYLSLLFDVRGIAAEDIPILAILKAVLGYIDTEHYTYNDLANEINLETGGIGASISTYTNVKDVNKYEAKFEIKTKVLYDKLPRAMEIIEEILLRSKLSDEKRLHEILSELKSRLQMNLSSSGNSVSAVRAMSYFSETSLFNDKISGIDFYRTVAYYEENFQEKKGELAAKLYELLGEVFTKDNFIVSITADASGYQEVPAQIKSLREKLPETKAKKDPVCLECMKKNEGFMDASKVQYVSRAGNFISKGFSYTGALKILKVILSYDYLWINIRVKGGAYGCGGGFMRSGNAYFSSYRDPNLTKTNEVYEKIPEYIANFTADERDMTKYIIGTVSDLDTPLNPAAKGERSMSAYLCGLTVEDLQRERDEVTGASGEDIRALSELVKAVLEQKNICVIGNEENITQQKELFMEIQQLF